MTARQEAFIREYIRTGMAKEAAVAAGYSEKTAAQQASRLLAMPEVQQRRVELETELYQQIGVSEAWVGRRLVEIAERCMQGEPHLSWNEETRKKEPDGMWVFDPKSAISALSKIGESLGMFRPVQEQSGQEMTVTLKVTSEEDNR